MNWKYRISITSLHKQYQTGELSLKELANSVANLLETIVYNFPDDSNLEFIIKWFSCIQNTDTIDNYDNILSELYYWADTNRVWIDCL